MGSVVLGVPFLFSAHAANALVAPLSSSAVALLVRATAPLSAPPASLALELEAAPSDATPSERAALDVDFGVGVAAKGRPRRDAKPPPKAKPSAVFVSQATVLQLAQSSARPSGSFVAASPQHPAGLRLAGVAGLGIGVQDGDILIEALGITPRAPGQVIGAIIEARAKQARFLSGTLWRQGQTFAITVEQPYLPARTPS